MPALSFKARFADDVESGAKRQTIRAWRKRPFRVGDRVYLYTGMRTKACRKLGESDCLQARSIELYCYRTDRYASGWFQSVAIDKDLLREVEIVQLAQADGFDTPREFFAFFLPDGGLFRGQLIEWAVPIS
jgi:hypothetical protein